VPKVMFVAVLDGWVAAIVNVSAGGLPGPSDLRSRAWVTDVPSPSPARRGGVRAL